MLFKSGSFGWWISFDAYNKLSFSPWLFSRQPWAQVAQAGELAVRSEHLGLQVSRWTPVVYLREVVVKIKVVASQMRHTECLF